MKRTEAIKKVQEYLDINSGSLNAEQLVAFIESIGMAPPEIETEFYDRANCDYHKVHEWETE